MHQQPRLKFKRFQLEDLARAACHDGAILAWEQGLGKTLGSLAWPLIKEARRVLLVAPGGLHLQMRKVALEKFGIHLTQLANRRQFFAHRLHLAPPLRKDGEAPRFFITTYQDLGSNGADEWPDTVSEDGFKSTRKDREKRRLLDPDFVRLRRAIAALNQTIFDPKPYFEGIGEERGGIRCVWTPSLATTISAAEGIGGGFDCVVVDEGTKLQANASLIARGVRRLNPRFRLVLTGTPIKNRLESAFWLCHWVCGGSDLPTARWPYEGTSEAREEFANEHLQHDRFLTREEEAQSARGDIPRDLYTVLLSGSARGNTLTFPPLAQTVYARVKKWVESHGGRWDRKAQTHIFGSSVAGILAGLRPIDAERRSGKSTIEKRSARLCNIHRLWKLLAPVIIRRRKDECGEEIVPKTLKPIFVLPGTAQQRVYAFHLANPPLAARGTPTRRVDRRVQIGMQLNCLRAAALCPETESLSETIVHPDAQGGERKSWTDTNPKQAAILSLIADLLDRGEQVIVGSPFRTFSLHLHRRLCEAGVSSLLLDGDTRPEKRGELAAAFKARLHAVLVAGIKAMGEGYDFDQCAHLILPSQSWAYDENEQFIHRIWRLTSPRPVTIYAMIMQGTIDERIHALWGEKGDAAQLALDGRLIEDQVEEVNLDALLQAAVRNFDPSASTIDEQDIEAQWQSHLRVRLHAAEQHFRLPQAAFAEIANHGAVARSSPLTSLSRLENCLAKARRKQGRR